MVTKLAHIGIVVTDVERSKIYIGTFVPTEIFTGEYSPSLPSLFWMKAVIY